MACTTFSFSTRHFCMVWICAGLQLPSMSSDLDISACVALANKTVIIVNASIVSDLTGRGGPGVPVRIVSRRRSHLRHYRPYHLNCAFYLNPRALIDRRRHRRIRVPSAGSPFLSRRDQINETSFRSLLISFSSRTDIASDAPSTLSRACGASSIMPSFLFSPLPPLHPPRALYIAVV